MADGTEALCALVRNELRRFSFDRNVLHFGEKYHKVTANGQKESLTTVRATGFVL